MTVKTSAKIGDKEKNNKQKEKTAWSEITEKKSTRRKMVSKAAFFCWITYIH